MLRARPSGAHGHFQQNRLIAFGQGHENPVSALFRNAIAAGVQFAHGGDFAERHEYARLLPHLPRSEEFHPEPVEIRAVPDFGDRNRKLTEKLNV